MPDVTPSRNSTCPQPKRSLATTLAALDGSRVAIHIVVGGREQFLRGEACYGFDSDLGKLLRVQLEGSEDSPEIIIAEATWNGQILPGHAVGSDYLIRLSC